MMVPPGLAFPTVVHTHAHTYIYIQTSYIIMYRCTRPKVTKNRIAYIVTNIVRVSRTIHTICVFIYIHVYLSRIFYYSLFAVHAVHIYLCSFKLRLTHARTVLPVKRIVTKPSSCAKIFGPARVQMTSSSL
jgi:hypothetical protein